MTVIKILKEVKIFIALIGIIILESYALSKGINGIALTSAIAGIAGLGGYELNNIIKLFKTGK